MVDAPRLDAYHFHEQEWDDYDDLKASFEWEMPETFNMATYACDRWAEERGKVALFAEDANGRERVYTYWQLRNEANRLANYLRAQGVERGDRVGVNMPQKPEYLASLFAVWKLGAVAVPLSTLFGPDAVQYRLDDCDAVAAVVDGSNVESFREARQDLNALETALVVDADPNDAEDDYHEVVPAQDRRFETVATDPEDDALLVYTSGTTGAPKGVRHAHRMLLGYLPGALTVIFNMDVRDDDLLWAPPEWTWVGSLFAQVMPAMFYGVPLLAYDGEGPFDAETALGLFEKYGVSLTFLPPTAMRMMMREEGMTDGVDLSSMRVIMSGGEAVGESIVDWAEDAFAGAAVHEAYGQTELNMLVGDCTALTDVKPGYIGTPTPGREVTVVDTETAEPLTEPDEVGEIAARYEGDPQAFKEYWNEPEKTAQKVRNGWLLTEDLGRMDAEGYVAFEGRKDDVIITSGHRVGPEDVEEALATHEAVAEAGVAGVPDDTRGEVPAAWVVLVEGRDGSDELATELQEHVKERQATYEYPRYVEFVEELPMTATGKIRRTALAERFDAA